MKQAVSTFSPQPIHLQLRFLPIHRKGEMLMCDLKAYVTTKGKEELLLEAVNQVRAENGMVTLRNLFGEEKTVRGEVREVSLVRNRLVIEQP
jgi:predicted RNA-binding protein